MIIECINCNKKFNVDAELIPSDGRQIQCGSCDHTWYYIIKAEIPTKQLIVNKTESAQESKIDVTQENTDDQYLIKSKQSTIFKQDFDTNELDIIVEHNRLSNFFSYLLVLIISFIALLILIDTIKLPLINIFPQLEIIIFNLFETLKDIKLFIIDLT
jgi:predicted Zn finger-like uncharacterized protein